MHKAFFMFEVPDKVHKILTNKKYNKTETQLLQVNTVLVGGWGGDGSSNSISSLQQYYYNSQLQDHISLLLKI